LSIRRRTAWIWVAAALPPVMAYQWWAHQSVIDPTVTPHTAVLLPLLIGHTGINLFLLWAFGRTLKPGRESLITGFARGIHGTLPPAIEAYTRNVTLAWCIVFALQVTVSAVLFALGRLELWSIFINLLSFPLVAATFVVEYAYRIMRFPDFPHVSIWTGMRLFAERRSREGETRPR
jgi:uncharacterized membrane protein